MTYTAIRYLEPGADVFEDNGYGDNYHIISEPEWDGGGFRVEAVNRFGKKVVFYEAEDDEECCKLVTRL